MTLKSTIAMCKCQCYKNAIGTGILIVKMWAAIEQREIE